MGRRLSWRRWPCKGVPETGSSVGGALAESGEDRLRDGKVAGDFSRINHLTDAVPSPAPFNVGQFVRQLQIAFGNLYG